MLTSPGFFFKEANLYVVTNFIYIVFSDNELICVTLKMKWKLFCVMLWYVLLCYPVYLMLYFVSAVNGEHGLKPSGRLFWFPARSNSFRRLIVIVMESVPHQWAIGLSRWIVDLSIYHQAEPRIVWTTQSRLLGSLVKTLWEKEKMRS